MNDGLSDKTNSYAAIKCPVCNSFGTLQYGKKVCHGCHGKGYIIIDNKTGLPVEKEVDVK